MADNYDYDYRSSYMSHYSNGWLDRAVALIVFTVFVVALYYALQVICMFWTFFKFFFAAVVICFSVWLVVMLFHIVYRYKAKTEVILHTLPMTEREYSYRTLPKKTVIHKKAAPSYFEEHNYREGYHYEDDE